MKSAVVDVCLRSSFPLYWAEWHKLCGMMNYSRGGDTNTDLRTSAVSVCVPVSA